MAVVAVGEGSPFDARDKILGVRRLENYFRRAKRGRKPMFKHMRALVLPGYQVRSVFGRSTDAPLILLDVYAWD